MGVEPITQSSKVNRKAIQLFGFQFVAAVIVTAVIYFLTNFIKIMPQSMSVHISSMPATILGAYYFGYWYEKHNPGTLNPELIKKICYRIIFWSLIVSAVFLLIFFTVQLSGGKPVDFEFVITMIFFIGFSMAITSLLYYWITKIFIKKGIANYRKKLASKINQVED